MFIDSEHTIVSDEFTKSFSAHGGLIHVDLQGVTISEKGSGILIENSPKLLQLSMGLSTSVNEQNGGFDPSTLKTLLKEKYKH